MLKIHTTNLIEIDLKKYKENSDKLDFLGSYAKPDSPAKLLKSTNHLKVSELVQTLKLAICWERPIFNDHNLPYYAITAYLEDKINREQISHILEFYELKSTYPNLISIPILTVKGKFTQASQYYFKYLLGCRRSSLPDITEEHLEKFRLSLLKNKSSSPYHVFYLLTRGSSEKKRNYVGISDFLGSIEQCELGDVFTPVSVRNIFYSAIAPKNSTETRSIGKLGAFHINDIEHGHRQNVRLLALGFPGTFRTTRVHGYNITQVDATGHDGLHQGAISYFPKHLYHMSLYCLDVIREQTKIKWSEELWPLVDMYVVDPAISVLHTFDDDSKKYSIDESLSDIECEQWITKIFKFILSDLLFDLILADMFHNKLKWEQWINVDQFISKNISNKFSKILIKKHYDINQLLEEDNIGQQLKYAYIAQCQSEISSLLNKYIHFEKNSNNRIDLSLFGVAMEHYSNDELKNIITDMKEKNQTGIQLLNSVSSGDAEALEEIINTVNLEQYISYLMPALKIAVKNGHDQCLNTLVNHQMINFSFHILLSLADAVKKGQIQCVTLLLERFSSSYDKNHIKNLLLLALKHKKDEISDLFLNMKIEISQYTLGEALSITLGHNDNLMTKKIFQYAAETNKTHQLLEHCSIHKMLQNYPSKCIASIMDALIGNSKLTYQTLFNTIAKSGSIECAHEFIHYVTKIKKLSEKQKNDLLMDCMLEGFSPGNGGYFTTPYNLHHEMIQLQLNQYLELSAKKFQFFQKKDVVRLIEKIYSPTRNSKNTLCELPFYSLLRKSCIISNQELIDLCINKALNHQESYYLRILIRADIKLTYSTKNNSDTVNNQIIKELPSCSVRGLVWLMRTIDEIKKVKPDSELIKTCLTHACSSPSFEIELISLIYSKQISVSVLKKLSHHLGEKEKTSHIKQLITEKIELLMEHKNIHFNQNKLSIFNQSTLDKYPLALADVLIYYAN